MKILIHDYSGHPFQVELSRELAIRGHTVLHLFSASFQTPKGALTKQPSDPENFDVVGLALKKAFQKNSFVQRRTQEIEFGHLVADKIGEFKPDIVVSSNSPLDTQNVIQKKTREVGARFYFWLQDIYSEAIGRILPKMMPVVGNGIGWFYKNLEMGMLKKSDGVICITSDFVDLLLKEGVKKDHLHVIENWAPLNELEPIAKDNDWARANMPYGDVKIVYSGTLGLKHKPELLLDLAKNLPNAHVYVFSEGKAADLLKAKSAEDGVTNITIGSWVPFETLPAMLSSADLFVAMIEEEAGMFCVPSKVLTYFCIGRPILASIPNGNLAQRLIQGNEAGIVGSPSNSDAFIAEAKRLATDVSLMQRMGDNGRRYAEDHFDIHKIADRFEAIFNSHSS